MSTKLEHIVSLIKGCTFASIDTVTEVKLSGGKSNPFQGRVTKVVTGSNVMLFSNSKTNGYDAMVKRRLADEGMDPESFVLGPRKWGTRVPEMPIVEHNGHQYLEVIFKRAGNSQLFLDGKPVDEMTKKLLDVYMPPENEESQGGLSNKVIIRTYRDDSIKSITIDKQKYEL